MKLTDLTKCDGIGRMQLERRIAALVEVVGRIETRIQERVDNATRTSELHPDPDARQAAVAREAAYKTALADLRCMLEDVP